MDLTTSMYLRSSARPPVKRISLAILGALIIHLLGLLYWWPDTRIEAPELPEWVNIRLVAGIEKASPPSPATQTSKRSESSSEAESVARESLSEPSVSRRKQHSKPTGPETSSREQKQETKSEPRKEKTDARQSGQTFVQADSKPFAMHNPRPVFPLSARRRGMQGTVILLVQVTANGKVSDVSVSQSSGYRVLDNSAIRAVQRWKFRPAQRRGDSVSTSVEVPVRFLLRDE